MKYINWRALINYIKMTNYQVGDRIRALHLAAEVLDEYEDWLRVNEIMEEDEK